MKLIKILFSKKFRREYSKKFANDYNAVNNRIEKIYTEAISEYNNLRNQVA